MIYTRVQTNKCGGRFLKDLSTWCSLLGKAELPLFNEVTFHLWSYVAEPDDVRASSNPRDQTPQLELALDLATLVSTTAQNISCRGGLLGPRFEEEQELWIGQEWEEEAEYSIPDIPSSHTDSDDETPTSILDSFRDRHKDWQEEADLCEHLPDAYFVWLAAGAIFAAMLCFLLSKCSRLLNETVDG